MGRMRALSQSLDAASTRRQAIKKGGPNRAAISRTSAALSARPGGLTELRSGGLRHRAADNKLNVAAANADVVEFAIRELRQLANRFAVAPPRGELLGNGLEGGHRCLLFEVVS